MIILLFQSVVHSSRQMIFSGTWFAVFEGADHLYCLKGNIEAMSAVNLDKIFNPKSVAVIGDSRSNGFIFSTLVENLIDGGYPGELYPIEPNLRSIRERCVHRSLLNLNAPVDLVVLAEPVTWASRIVTECIETGVKGLIMVSGGGKRMGGAAKS